MALPETVIKFGILPKLLEGPKLGNTALGSPDRLEQQILFDWAAGWEVSATALGWRKGKAAPGFPTMFVDEFTNIEQDSERTGTMTVNCVGLLDGTKEKRLRRTSGFGNTVALGPVEKVEDKREFVDIAVTGWGLSDRWNIKDPELTVIDRYISTVEGDTAQIGAALSPPSPPGAPPYLWSGYNEPMRSNAPNGWVLDDRSNDERITDELWIITDVFVYIQPAIPD